MLRKNQRYTVEIAGYTAEGAGVAKVDGQVVFVREVILGEVAEIVIDHVGKRFAVGSVEKLCKVSPNRVNRACQLGKRCGGCDFWHMDYQEECRLKAQRVADALQRIGEQHVEYVPICGGDSMVGYRNKVQLPVAKGKNGVVAGFYQAGTHKVIPAERCLIQPEVADLAKEIVLQWMAEWKIPGYNEEKHSGCVRHIYVRTSQSGQQVMVCLVTLGINLPKSDDLLERLQEKIPGLRTLVQVIQPNKTNVILGNQMRIIHGDGYIEEELYGSKFRISPWTFFQVNRKQAEKLYEKAMEYADLKPGDVALDLYCGAGTITLAMAKSGAKVIGVEVVEPAVLDARVNAEVNQVENVEFICADAGAAAKTLAKDGIAPDVIVVDPPRKGLSTDVVEAILQMSPTRLVYVSCDPATLARDVKALTSQGYALEKVHAFDLFPRCAHVETVVSLIKQKPIDHIKVELDLDELDLTKSEMNPTYPKIKAFVEEKYGFKVSSLYIAQVKDKYGLDKRENYNFSKKDDAVVPQCPPEKEEAIIQAFKHYGLI